MKLYAQYFQWNLAHKLVEAMGTDQICPLDGRWSITTAKRKAREYADRLKHVKRFAGFTIQRGNLRHSIRIYSALPTVPGTTVFHY